MLPNPLCSLLYVGFKIVMSTKIHRNSLRYLLVHIQLDLHKDSHLPLSLWSNNRLKSYLIIREQMRVIWTWRWSVARAPALQRTSVAKPASLLAHTGWSRCLSIMSWQKKGRWYFSLSLEFRSLLYSGHKVE